MQSTMVLVISRVLDVALRIWMKDKETYVVNNVLDITKLATKIGCDYFETCRLETNIKQCINNASEKLYSAHFLDGIEVGRRKEIVQQIINDLEAIDTSDEEFYKNIMMDKDITKDIMKKSEKDRALWNPKEKGRITIVCDLWRMQL